MDVQRVNDLGIFRGLSVQCPAVIELAVQEVLMYMKDPYVLAISVSGWKGFGSKRIVKYAARRALVESKLFDNLIWVIGRRKDSSIKNFQLQIADRLQISYPKNGDSDDEDEQNVDENLSRRIHECLKNQKFLFLHDGNWDLHDLGRMGIPPRIGSAKNSMILVSSTASRRRHEHVSLVSLSSDLLHEEGIDIANSLTNPLNLECPITANAVVDCILYFLLFDVKVKTETLLRLWFAEGFIGSPRMDLDETFKFGEDLLDELQDRHRVELQEGFILPHADEDGKKKILGGNAFPRKFRGLDIGQTHNAFEKLDDIDWFTMWVCPGSFPSNPTNCTKLSTIINSGCEFSTLFPKTFFESMKNVRVLYLAKSLISTLPSSLACLCNSLKLLSLHNCKYFSRLPLLALKALGKLEVLDLSGTPLELSDNSFEGLESLRLLDLSTCLNIVSLPSSISCLLNLEQLLLTDCVNLKALPSSVQPLKKLLLLDLSRASLIEIPDQFFQHMVKLKDLNLSFNCCLRTLPTSISNLINLKKLNLSCCSELQTITPTLQRLSSSLEELNLSACTSLQDMKFVSSSMFNAIPNVRILNLFSIPINSIISFRDCSHLENLILGSNTNLNVLDLSGTNIKKFPLENSPKSKTLKCLNLLGTKHLVKVDWKSICWLPQEVNWDQCGDANIPLMHVPLNDWRKDGNGCGAFICTESGNIFKSLTSSNPCLNGMSRFLVYVCPCLERGTRKTLPPQRKGCCYKEIYSTLKPSVPLYQRCLEIARVKKFPKGLSGILSHAQFLSVHDEAAVVRLSDLGLESMGALKQCLIERCHAMQIVFDIGLNVATRQVVLGLLENLQISNLRKLINMCVSSEFLPSRSFGHLKHLQLEYCPHIVTVFSSSVRLESLEVLKIRFCARLEEIFAAKVNAQGSLQRLRTLSLLELPALYNIVHNVQLVALKSVKVQGCPKLRKFPSHTSSSNSHNMVDAIEVTGESEWWQQLQWDANCSKERIRFNSWKRSGFNKAPSTS